MDEALEIRAARNAIPYGGGTDLMIKADPDADYLFLENIEELKRVYEDLEFIHFSAGCTFSELLKNSLAPGILKEALKGIAAPAIRNFGTIGGNIANGSAKADSALVFIAADSKIKLQSVRGERVIPLKSFYLGRKRTALEKDEIATEVLMPKKWLNCCSYHKVGARKALAISRISFAGFFSVEKGKIAHNAVAFGAVEDVFIRRPDLDEMLLGLTLEEAKKAKPKYLKAYEDAINPTEGRVSASYRKAVCLNLLGEFIDSMLKREYS
ncbi:MAG: FAD binding domain-containing protein [Clostridiales bacterium]|nr:FAD binding domain-containing protein [Clostridiales bacterium]